MGEEQTTDFGEQIRYPDTVVCFDRDYTVSVNPHPNHEAVPLSWVKHLAHERREIHVWATGNQYLRKEAAIPGINEAITSWQELMLPDSVERFREYVPPQSARLGRKEGLALVRAIYEELNPNPKNQPDFIVVDDVDLSGLGGYEHKFPWTFVDAIESGTAPVDVQRPVSVSDVPLTESNCPESYPPVDRDDPAVLRLRE
ncbi:hypothetical protein ACFQJ7_08515 [Halovenus rubra]|uniref:Uncharacterized protein n=2 Tax=Halovenus rubra TaxID=869890 RepID=A0ACC7E7H6_9EURY|nr:hypothetical protein [Halovenus rubra]